MQSKVEQVGPCKRKLNVEVPAEDVKSKLDENYENLRKNVDLPGFRKGHVPRSLLERRFGEDVANEVRQTLLDESYNEAIEEHKLEVVGRPQFPDELPSISIDTPFSYTVTLEVKPEFELPGYSRLKLKNQPVEPTDEDIKSRIDYYRHRMASFEVVEGEAGKEDMIVADVHFKVGDEIVMKRENLPVAIISEQVAGVPFENLADALTGAKAGETRNVETTFPEDYHMEEHRGKQAEVSFEIREVKRLVLPEVTDEWVKDMGFDSLDEFNEELRNQIRRIKERSAREDMQVQIRDQLADMVDMTLPEDLAAEIKKDNDTRQRMILRHEGLSEEEIEARMKEKTGESEETNAKNIKLYFIFDAIAKKEKLFVTEDELGARIDQLAVNYGMEAEQFKKLMESDGRIDTLRKEMVDEKILDLLIEKAEVEEVPPGEPMHPAGEETENAEEAKEEGNPTE